MPGITERFHLLSVEHKYRPNVETMGLLRVLHARIDFVTRTSNREGHRARASRPEPEPIEIVSGRWLVHALVGCLVAAGIALYLSVCLLFYQGQWQFVFSTNPKKMPGVAEIAKTAQLPIEDVRFDYTEEGQARLEGWWIPAPDANAPVVLFCPNGRNPLPENTDAFRALHALGASVFAFDYRDIGDGRHKHPSQQKAYANGIAALAYLTGMRNIPPRKIVVYGVGAGAAVAVHVAAQTQQANKSVAALVLEDPQLSLTQQVKREQRIHALPMHLIFTDNFSIAAPLPTLKMPKLIVSTAIQPEYPAGARQVDAASASPKQIVETAAPNSAALYNNSAWQTAMRNLLRSTATQSH